MARRIAALILILIAGVTRAQAQGPPIKVCMLSGSEEYHSDASLEAFKTYLEANFPAKCTLLKAKGVSDLPGLEALDDCDVALFFTRRLTIDGEQLARIKRYAQAGRPIVAVRTASHGFQNWLEFDKEVLGGNYHGHYRDDLTVRAERNGYNLPDVLTNPLIDLASTGSLYKTSPLAKDVNSLLFGTTPEGREPVSWVRENKGRVFYTSFGTPSDFENASFRQLLANALFWAVERRETPRPAPPPRQRTRPDGTLRLKLRLRTEAFKGSNDWDVVNVTKELPVADTAIVICDMWDRHWCTGATKRCDAIAQHMAPVIKAARAAGVQIVHAPSECMGFYADTPQRLRMKLAPKAQLPNPKEIFEPPLPIDDSDGGCDTNDAFYLA
ncbi:MAG TPA: ThuA domain-containing protein, partial [Isosphaeraceae bacterium]|nr:ThuA domain-containing protein [Isosphaeraceae bacterium]